MTERRKPAQSPRPVDVTHNIVNQLQFALSALELGALDQAEVAVAEVRLMLAQFCRLGGIEARRQGRRTMMIRDRMDQLLWEWSTHLITCRQCAVWDLAKDLKVRVPNVGCDNAPPKPCEHGRATILRMEMYLHEMAA